MNKRTKALQIPASVKARVHARDGGRCILCGAQGDPVAHFISRAQGGLGVEQNIFTACQNCHGLYDQTVHREILRGEIMTYLRTKYPNWDDVRLTYQK